MVWRWKVYDRDPYIRVHFLQAMEEACLDITVEACQGWIRHVRGFFPRCLARANIDVMLMRISGLTQTRDGMLRQNKCDFFLYVQTVFFSLVYIGKYMEIILLYSTFFMYQLHICTEHLLFHSISVYFTTVH